MAGRIWVVIPMYKSKGELTLSSISGSCHQLGQNVRFQPQICYDADTADAIARFLTKESPGIEVHITHTTKFFDTLPGKTRTKIVNDLGEVLPAE